MNNHLIVILGPTASGKTALSIALAQHFDAEIISCDSRQFYKEMNIGTAKPDAAEQAAAPHHFVDCRSISEDYSVGDYERDVMAFLEDYYKRKNTAILVGGSGLYVHAVCNGVDVFPEVDRSFREKLLQELEEFGIEPLQKELEISDPVYYAKVDLANPHRLVRALEICRSTGKPFSDFHVQNTTERPFKIIKIGIEWEREMLYDRINRRVDLMLEAGLVEEAKKLYPQRHLNALQTVGYQEFFDYFENKITLPEAIELVKRNTRRYAKRQMTWFRKEKDLYWIKAGTETKEVVAWLKTQIEE